MQHDPNIAIQLRRSFYHLHEMKIYKVEANSLFIWLQSMLYAIDIIHFLPAVKRLSAYVIFEKLTWNHRGKHTERFYLKLNTVTIAVMRYWLYCFFRRNDP